MKNMDVEKHSEKELMRIYSQLMTVDVKKQKQKNTTELAMCNHVKYTNRTIKQYKVVVGGMGGGKQSLAVGPLPLSAAFHFPHPLLGILIIN